jgi:glycosyltransferase involved in cell wall biosynthesis
MMNASLPLISVVIVGYRRVDLMTRTLRSFLEVSSYPRERLELIACDDGSGSDQQSLIRQLPFDIFLLAATNQGLGRNTNKGLQAARGAYILQLQDDWLCLGPSDFLEAAIELLEERPDVSLVRFHPRACESLPGEEFTTASGRQALIVSSGLYRSSGMYSYSDNPHIKRAAFHRRIGMYRERVPMTVMELDFCARVDRDADTKIAFLEGYCAFEHLGRDRSFNPTQKLRVRKIALLRNPITRWPFILFLRLKRLAKYRAEAKQR